MNHCTRLCHRRQPPCNFWFKLVQRVYSQSR